MIRQFILYFGLGLILGWLICLPVWAGEPPAAAVPYQRMLTREARLVGGLNAPVAMFAGQIEQESAWRPSVCSAFACGLTQFTPDTAAWIASLYKSDLGEANVYDPEWAIRAMLRYDARLFDSVSAATECDRWAFALSGYNGGPGWISRDRKTCARDVGCDPTRWFGAVELHSGRSPAAMTENRRYPRRILGITQFNYAQWGRTVSCPI